MVESKDMKVALEVLDELSKTNLKTLRKDTQSRITELRIKLEKPGHTLKLLLDDQIRRLDNIITESKKIENNLNPTRWFEEKDPYRSRVMLNCWQAASYISLDAFRLKLKLIWGGQTESDRCFITSIPERAPKIKDIDWSAYVSDLALEAAGCVPYVGFVVGPASAVKSTVSTFFRTNARFKNSVKQVMNILGLLYFLDVMGSKGIVAVESLVSERKKQFGEIGGIIDGWESFLDRIKEEMKNIGL